MAKTRIDIVTGFLGSGKTTFINYMLENKKASEGRNVVIQCEAGEIEVNDKLLKGGDIIVNKLEKGIQADAKYLDSIIGRYLPDKIIIELNGMSKTEELLLVLDERDVRKSCRIDRVINLIDAATFDVFMNNMGAILTEQIVYSDLILIINFDKLTKEKLKTMERTIRALNKSAEIAWASDSGNDSTEIDNAPVCEEKRSWLSKPSDKLFAGFIILIAGYLSYVIISSIDFQTVKIDLTWLQVLNTVFLSIIIQAFPFILIGVFVSSIMQVFISSDTVVRIFPKKKLPGFVVAIIAGLFFPVCDCAIVPVTARLVKKGVPLPAAVTFMLAAPIVNPIVIASTLYAFPGQPEMAAYRVYLGITIALTVGVAFLIFRRERTLL